MVFVYELCAISTKQYSIKSMNNSSNSIFHFTNDFEIIKSIITDKFYGSYCKETINYNGEKATIIVPMISFCDIPLKLVSQKTKYGKYGIGMSKKWAEKNGLNPVFYLEKNSFLANSMIKAFSGITVIANHFNKELDKLEVKTEEMSKKTYSKTDLIDLKEDNKKMRVIFEGLDHTVYSLYFTKHVMDNLERNGKITRNYKFYDEREWRYVPELKHELFRLYMDENKYLLWRGNEKQKPILQEVNLDFKPNDIEYIIVEKKSEKKKMIDFIKSLEYINSTQKENLYSKILSFQELKEDI